MKERPMYELRLVVHGETESAWRVSETGDPDEAVWLPKSQCIMGEARPTKGSELPMHDFTMPEWLAEAKGLC